MSNICFLATQAFNSGWQFVNSASILHKSALYWSCFGVFLTVTAELDQHTGLPRKNLNCHRVWLRAMWHHSCHGKWCICINPVLFLFLIYLFRPKNIIKTLNSKKKWILFRFWKNFSSNSKFLENFESHFLKVFNLMLLNLKFQLLRTIRDSNMKLKLNAQKWI